MTFKIKTRFLILFICFTLFATAFSLKVDSNQVVVPLTITVHGKLIITDAESDNKSGENPTLNVILNLTPSLNSTIVSGKTSMRIRTNLSNWKLTAKRFDLTSNTTNIDPKDVSLTFTTQTGSKANPFAGKLISPFDSTCSLDQIPDTSTTDILVGSSKTSLDKDPGNKNNWFQLNSDYSISPDFFYGRGEWRTIISYNLVSP